MIIVNVRVPALEKVYNLSLEEKAKTEDLIEEIMELILQKERIRFHGELKDMVLCSSEAGIQLKRDRSLADYGISGGDELILL